MMKITFKNGQTLIIRNVKDFYMNRKNSELIITYSNSMNDNFDLDDITIIQLHCGDIIPF